MKLRLVDKFTQLPDLIFEHINIVLIVLGLLACLYLPSLASRYQNSYRSMIYVLVIALLILKVKPLFLFYGFVFLSWFPLRINFSPVPLLGRLLTDALALEATALILGGLWLVFTYLHGERPNRYLSSFFGPCLLMLLGGLIALPNSMAPLESLLRYRNVIVYTILVFLVTAQMLKTTAQATKVIQLLLISWCLLGIYAIWAKQVGMAGTELNTMGGLRLGGTIRFGSIGYIDIHPNTISVCLAFLLPLAYAFILSGETAKQQYFGLVITIILAVALFLTYGRGAYYAATAGLIVVSLVTWIRDPKRIRRSLLIPLLFVALIVIIYPQIPLPKLVIDRLAELANPLQAATFTSRVDRWQLALSTQPKQLLWGWGFAGSPVMPGWIWEHNALLYWLDGIGVLGSIGFLWLLMRAAFLSWRVTYTQDPQRLLIGSGIIGSIAALFVVGITYGWPFSAMEASMTGIVLGTAVVAMACGSKLSGDKQRRAA